MLDAILRQQKKANISNYLSHVTYDDSVVGIGNVVCVCKGLGGVKAAKATVAFRSSGSAVSPRLLSRDWYPWGIYSSYYIGLARTRERQIRKDGERFFRQAVPRQDCYCVMS